MPTDPGNSWVKPISPRTVVATTCEAFSRRLEPVSRARESAARRIAAGPGASKPHVSPVPPALANAAPALFTCARRVSVQGSYGRRGATIRIPPERRGGPGHAPPGQRPAPPELMLEQVESDTGDQEFSRQPTPPAVCSCGDCEFCGEIAWGAVPNLGDQEARNVGPREHREGGQQCGLADRPTVLEGARSAAATHLAGRQEGRVVHVLGVQQLGDLRLRVPPHRPKVVVDAPLAVAGDHRLQHQAPASAPRTLPGCRRQRSRLPY